MFKKKLIVGLIVAFVLLLSSIGVYAYYNSQKTNDFSNSIAVLSDGGLTGNMGGASNVDDSTKSDSDDTWITSDQTRRDGVRVTIVEAETGLIRTSSIDFAMNPDHVDLWFGNVCKFSYLGIGNPTFTLDFRFDEYNYTVPDYEALPNILYGDIKTIKAYFEQRKFLEYFCSVTGFSYDEFETGNYKLIIEPILYFYWNGLCVAGTPTQIALYNQSTIDKKTNPLGSFRSNSILQRQLYVSFPQSLYLEEEDFGIQPFNTFLLGEYLTDEMIINQMGIGIVYDRGKDEDEDIGDPLYIYRTNTTVYTSITGLETSNVVGKVRSDKSTLTTNPTRVTFALSDDSDGAKIIETEGTVWKEDDTAWIKWTTPNVEKTMSIIVTVEYAEKESTYNDFSYVDENGRKHSNGSYTSYSYPYTSYTIKIPIEIVGLEENTPPNPVADDRNDSFSYTEVKRSGIAMENELTNSWVEYDLNISNDTTLWTKYTYEMTLTPEIVIYPDTRVFTAEYEYGEYTMKSGYGFRIDLVGTMNLTTTIEEEYLETEIKTNPVTGAETERIAKKLRTTTVKNDKTYNDYIVTAQNGLTYFSDFNYETYWRLLEVKEEKTRTSTLGFRTNPYSTYGHPVHFTPVWYPDNTKYTVIAYLFDAWTPAGQLYATLDDSINILGSVWDDFHVAPAPYKELPRVDIRQTLDDLDF